MSRLLVVSVLLILAPSFAFKASAISTDCDETEPGEQPCCPLDRLPFITIDPDDWKECDVDIYWPYDP